MSQEEFSASFNGSPMNWAKLRELQRNAAVVLGNVSKTEDVDVLTPALDDAEPPVREPCRIGTCRAREAGGVRGAA